LNVAAGEAFTATPVAPSRGDTELTAGGVVSAAAAVVKDQVWSAARALPAASWTPVVIVAVYVALLASAADGRKVAVVPESVTVPATPAVPRFRRKVAVVTVEALNVSLNVAETVEETGTAVAPFTGEVDATVGGVVSGAALVVNVQE
jgi:hypothetical protein